MWRDFPVSWALSTATALINNDCRGGMSVKFLGSTGKHAAEHGAVQTLFADLPNRADYLTLWGEYVGLYLWMTGTTLRPAIPPWELT